MINYELQNLFTEDSVDKQFLITTDDGITIDNTMIHSEQFSLDESICRDEQMVFGSCEASSIQFKVSNVIAPLIGKWLTVKIVLDGNTTKPFTLGRYKVESDKPTADRSYRDVVAYDVMYDILNADVTEWFNGLSFPISFRNFRNSFFSYVGINQETTSLPNDSINIDNVSSVESLTGKTVLNALLEINATVGHITRDNKFRYIEFLGVTDPLFPSNTLYPANDLFPANSSAYDISGRYISADYEDYECKKITKCSIKQSGEDNTNIVTEGTDGNEYLINDNFLLYGMTDNDLHTIANNFLTRVQSLIYRPFTCRAKGNPCVEVGDRIRVNTQKQIINSFVFERHLTGVQALIDDFSSKGKETYTQDLNSQSEQIVHLKGSINRLERTSEQTLSEIESLEESTTSRFTQTANSISAEVTRAKGAEETITGLLSLKLSKTDTESLISMIEGMADHISFTANNMFTVTAPNLEISEDGTVVAKSLDIQGGKININSSNEYDDVIELHLQEGTLGSRNMYLRPHSLTLNEISSSGKTRRISISSLSINGDNFTISNEDGHITAVQFNGDVVGKIKSSNGQTVGIYGSEPYYFRPDVDNKMTSGSSSYRWSTVYAGTGTINTSDANMKQNIAELDDRHVELFERLVPSSFQFVDGTSGRTHIGFIAQDVELAMAEVGLTALDFAGFCKDVIENEDGTTTEIYGLRYSEFIALNTKMIQKTRKDMLKLKQDLIKKGVLDE